MLSEEVNQKRSLDHDLPYWLALGQRPHLFPAALIERCIDRISSIRGVWESDERTLVDLGFEKRSIRELNKLRDKSTVAGLYEQADELRTRGIRVIKIVDLEYPPRLRLIRTMGGPPLLLFHKGTLTDFTNCVAVVGTRNASFRGRQVARKLAKKLTEKGFIVASGLARGIDFEAHSGALESKQGKTLAVLPWFEPIYPEEHSEFTKEIEARGARIAEMYQKPLSTMTPGKFVERNRITSGVSKFVVIIETGEDGGTIRQAEVARQQNKPIYVLSPIGNERAGSGFHTVVEKHGGIAFKDANDLLKKLAKEESEAPTRLSEFDIDEQRKLL